MRLCAIASLLLISAACAPSLDVKASRVTDVRVVAVRAVPAEARPGANVTWTALVVTPDGALMDAPVDWAFCLVPRPPTTSASVSYACLADVGTGAGGADASALDAGAPDGGADAGPPPPPALVSVPGSGHVEVRARIPADACARVGPQVPPAAMDGSRQRAPDPDVTGGYYLPIRVTAGADVAFARQRLRCALPDLPSATATAYAARYVNNQNPVMADVTVAGVAAPTDGTPVPVSASARLELVTGWTPESIEDYVAVDQATRELVPHTESMQVQWYTNGGTFAHDRTTANADLLTSTNVLSIDAGRTDPVTVWVVLEDERGGVEFRTLLLSPM